MTHVSHHLKRTPLVDRFGREVSYVRISVTDRCDFRCVYCMDENMTFVPRSEVLSLEEIQCVAEAFVELGVSKIRLTGGEPLIRANMLSLCSALGKLDGLNELVMTTNGSHLVKYAAGLKAAGIKRLNISLDSLDATQFKTLTRTGELDAVLAGIEAAIAQGFERIKLNTVILKGRNDQQVLPLVHYALEKNIDISFIEEMPLGAISEHSRAETFCSNDELFKWISSELDLRPLDIKAKTSGPTESYQVQGSKTRIGFISPHSHNFCGDCNRVRVTAEGRLLLCLGNEHSVDLRAILRTYPNDKARLKQAIIAAMDLKPKQHEFDHSNQPQILRFMNMTGG
jgi:cyclic pyranopterin phosphate synthase